jgi:hypothetical protein
MKAIVLESKILYLSQKEDNHSNCFISEVNGFIYIYYSCYPSKRLIIKYDIEE